MPDRRPRPVWILFVPWAAAGCAPGADFDGTGVDPTWCGLPAAMDYRQTEALKERPPACALPTAEEVASSCAIHDLVTKPGYRGPSYDEEGNSNGDGERPPEYRVSALSCRFTTRHRNRATCRFDLSLPQTPAAPAIVAFEHRFWQDHGPAHHFYGTSWSPTDRCMPVGA